MENSNFFNYIFKKVPSPIYLETGRVKGFGYVEFDSVGSLDSALGAGPYELGGRSLTVDKAGNKPSGGGGGMLLRIRSMRVMHPTFVWVSYMNHIR